MLWPRLDAGGSATMLPPAFARRTTWRRDSRTGTPAARGPSGWKVVVDKHSQARPASLGCDVDAHGVRANHQERRRADGVPHLVGRRTSARDDFVEGQPNSENRTAQTDMRTDGLALRVVQADQHPPATHHHDDWLMCDEKRE